ncbi:LOW QUALITY PROTEIN: interferon-induced protein with tetratricopeptide repeats 1B-like [Choloepus didactylus]|uniref:LOW QUALITY PROTEIN: interferon-induced protein with tetratricopeptide repeats 1B-like n=1 Tax=Choloepus didactylus TaxID=27675 RepID=UPI0018A0CD84|nr:LOW QUALITY PROTEIN: interferon-induced protein with tetratricopeptide repeats 1B-like [Choloepus didactylus]
MKQTIKILTIYFHSKNADEYLIKDRLEQLRCHFTWTLLIEDTEIPDLENRVLEEIQFLDTKYNVGIHNLLAYVQHLKDQNEEALKSLKEAEDLIQQEHANQPDLRSLVTWGNYAWVYYHMGRLAETQTYLDKVENTCAKFANPSCYRMECPEMDCEEGWALLKCGGKNYERAKACFEKALEADPENPESSTGYAITLFRPGQLYIATEKRKNGFSLCPLRQAIRLNPEDAYIKALLALKLQDVGHEAEGEKYIEEALTSKSSQTYVWRYAAKFYRRKGSLDEALRLLKKALQATPASSFLHHQMGICYRNQMIQIKQATNNQPRGLNGEKINRLVQLAIEQFQKTLQLKPTFKLAYIDLAEMYAEMGLHRKAEDTFQEVLDMKNTEELQQIHYHYGRFQEFHNKSEDKAITQYLKGLKIEKMSSTREKLLNALEKLAKKRLQQNVHIVQSFSLLGLVHKEKGEVRKALECYERALRLATGLNPELF